MFSSLTHAIVHTKLESSLVEHTPQYEKETKRLENNIVETTLEVYKTYFNIFVFVLECSAQTASYLI